MDIDTYNSLNKVADDTNPDDLRDTIQESPDTTRRKDRNKPAEDPWYRRAYNRALDFGIDALESKPGTALRGIGTGIVNSLATPIGLVGTSMKTLNNSVYDATSAAASVLDADPVRDWTTDKRNESSEFWNKLNKDVYSWAGDLYDKNKPATGDTEQKIFQISNSIGELIPDVAIPTAVAIKAHKYSPRLRNITHARNFGKAVNAMPAAPNWVKSYANWVSAHPKLAATGAAINTALPLVDAATGYSHVAPSDPTWRKALPIVGNAAQWAATAVNPLAGMITLPTALPAASEGIADASAQVSASWLPRMLSIDRRRGVVGPVKDQLMTTLPEDTKRALQAWWESPSDLTPVKEWGVTAARRAAGDVRDNPDKYKDVILGSITKPTATIHEWARDRAQELPSDILLRLTGLQDISKAKTPAAMLKRLIRRIAPSDTPGHAAAGYAAALGSTRNRERFFGEENLEPYNEAMRVKQALERENAKLAASKDPQKRVNEILYTSNLDPDLIPYRDALLGDDAYRQLAYKLLNESKLAKEWKNLPPEVQATLKWGGQRLLAEIAAALIREGLR